METLLFFLNQLSSSNFHQLSAMSQGTFAAALAAPGENGDACFKD